MPQSQTLARAPLASPPNPMEEVIERWINLFYPLFDMDPLTSVYRLLSEKKAFSSATPEPEARTEAEERLFTSLGNNLPVGFCIGGRLKNSLTPSAYEMVFRPLQAAPVPDRIQFGNYRFWGVPDVIQRLYSGYDANLPTAIAASGKWGGTTDELVGICDQFRVRHPSIPIRDAVDFVHSSIYITIKTLKFSPAPQSCGGPIEVAVITTDRPFRWVRHKAWDAAINEGEHYGG